MAHSSPFPGKDLCHGEDIYFLLTNLPPLHRQYEERELRAQQERAKKRMEYDAQIDRISSNLEFERSRDTQSE